MALIDRRPERSPSLMVVLGSLALAVALSVGTGARFRGAWKRLLLACALAPVPVAILASDNVAAAATVIGLLTPTSWLGRELAGRWLAPIEAAAAWSIGCAAALGGLIALGITLGLLGLLRPSAIWPAAAAALLVLLRLRRRRLIGDLNALVSWVRQPAAPDLDVCALAGVLLVFFWLNLIGALAPEIMSDAIRVRLPVAALFASTGRLTPGPDLPASAAPGAGEVLNAVFLAVGPLQAAKLVSFLTGLLCALSVWALGNALNGPRAGWVAALVFSTLPLVSWLSQTAYSDLLGTLFAVTGVLLLVLHDQPRRGSLMAAGACLVLGLGVKASFLPIAAGLLLALVLVVPSRQRIASGVVATLLAPVLPLAALRSELPLARVADVVTGSSSPSEFAAQLFDGIVGQIDAYAGYGTDHSPGSLIRSALDLTFSTHLYNSYQDGFAGYLLFALAPLIVFVKSRSHLKVVAVVSIVAYVVWFGFAQDLRYGLPIFALLCSVSGVAFTQLLSARRAGLLFRLSLVALTMFSVIGYLNTILIFPGEVPYRVTFGQQDKSAYLSDHVPAYAALRLLDAEPGATRAATTSSDYAQLYTRVNLVPLLWNGWAPSMPWSSDEDALLHYLDQERFSHIVVNRASLWPSWDKMLGSSEEFLRRNAALVGGEQNAYLYRIVPPDQRGQEQPWARGPELLPNGDFELLSAAGPLGWSSNGSAGYDTSGQQSRSGRVAVRSVPGTSWVSSVRVVPGTQYLLSHATRSVGDYALSRLQINWHDEAGLFVGVVIEVVPVSPASYRQRSMLATAPPNAVLAEVYAQAQEGEVWFDDFSLRAVSAD